MTIYAPQVDTLIEQAIKMPDALDTATRTKVAELCGKLSEIKVCGGDERREIWLRAERGDISSFGAYEDYLEMGDVESRMEFEELWKAYYPDETKWYKLVSITYNNTQSIFIDGKLVFELTSELRHNYSFNRLELAMWLKESVECAIALLQTGRYNMLVSENLPYRNRFGRILRSDFREICPLQKEAHLKGISPESIQRFVDRIETQPENPRIIQMTAGVFFECCRLGYAANRYENVSTKTAKELYIANADGRDDGLLELDEHSPEEFADWFHNKSNRGGHPWEVCRGGNSTHISLCVNHDERGWSLMLVGSSWSRSAETVNFYLALSDNGYPITLHDGAVLARMLTGADYIGIVPEVIMPVYCESLFPERMLDFMNLPLEEDERNKVIAAAEWYAPQTVCLV